MGIEAEVIAFPRKTKLVCSGCGAPGEGSCGCGVAYVTPGFRAEKAVKANPEKSDRELAAELGVGRMTVGRAREATVPHGTVEKRVGKDGKARKQPTLKPRGTGKTAEKYQQTRTAVRGALETGQAVNTKDVAEALGVSVDTVERAALAEQARADVFAEFKIDPVTLSMSAQAKLDVAVRQIERKLNTEHAKRMAGVDEEVRLRVLDETKEYLAMLKAKQAKAASTEKLYREWIDNATPIFTEPEFFTILKALDPAIEHRLTKPDPALVKLFNDATVLMNRQRERLTLKKK